MNTRSPVVLITGAPTGTPEEIAQSIVFLASDKARFLSGPCLVVDGGFTAP